MNICYLCGGDESLGRLIIESEYRPNEWQHEHHIVCHIELQRVRAEIRALTERCERLELYLREIKERCAGDAMPRWENMPRTTNSRGVIMYWCDEALRPTAAKEQNDGHT